MFQSIYIVLFTLFYVAFSYEEVFIIHPESLRQKYADGMQHSPAMFGVPSYASQITGRIYYATSEDGKDGCEPLNPEDFPDGEKIIMVDRGSCTFTEKVRHIQNAGGTAGIIVDNVEENFLPYMGDDGSGLDIYVPSILITMETGDDIKEALGDNYDDPVILTIKWSLPQPDGRVEWELWTSSNDPESRQFKSTFGESNKNLGEHAMFTPRYFVLSGESSGCLLEYINCGNQCDPSGRYCSADPDDDLEDGLSGFDILEENIRQICMFEELNNTGHADLWFDYSTNYIKQCCEPSGDFITGSCTLDDWGETCSYNVMSDLNIDTDKVKTCVTNSWNDDGTNTILEKEMTDRYDDSIYFMPSVMVNNSPYRGTLNCPFPVNAYSCGILEAICAGYLEGTEPETCKGDEGCPAGLHRDECEICGGDGKVDECGVCMSQSSPYFNQSCKASKNSVSAGGVFFIILVAVAAISAGVYYYVQKQQQRMKENIDDILRSYLPLEEANVEAGHSDDSRLLG